MTQSTRVYVRKSVYIYIYINIYIYIYIHIYVTMCIHICNICNIYIYIHLDTYARVFTASHPPGLAEVALGLPGLHGAPQQHGALAQGAASHRELRTPRASERRGEGRFW